MLCIIQLERVRGCRSSVFLFLFWVMAVVCSLVPLRAKIQLAMDEVRQRTDVEQRITQSPAPTAHTVFQHATCEGFRIPSIWTWCPGSCYVNVYLTTHSLDAWLQLQCQQRILYSSLDVNKIVYKLKLGDDTTNSGWGRVCFFYSCIRHRTLQSLLHRAGFYLSSRGLWDRRICIPIKKTA